MKKFWQLDGKDMETQPRLNVIWGAKRIGKLIGVNERQAFHLLQTGKIPAKKVGSLWCAEENQIREFITGKLEPEAVG